jgi:hypothetical protein
MDIASCAKLYESVDVPSGWLRVDEGVRPPYRLADCVEFLDCGVGRTKYPLSLAARFFEEAAGSAKLGWKNASVKRQGHCNLPMLLKVVQEFQCPQLPEPGAAVVHLRLGDVIEKSASSALSMLNATARPWYHHGHLSSVRNVLTSLRDMRPISEVHLVGGNHLNAFSGRKGRKSFVYFHCMGEALKAAGYRVTLHTNTSSVYDVDAAFCFMASARKLVTSTGDFSLLVGLLAQQAGAHVGLMQTKSSISSPCLRNMLHRRDTGLPAAGAGAANPPKGRYALQRAAASPPEAAPASFALPMATSPYLLPNPAPAVTESK